jgi:hypothetical protein
MSTSIMWSTTLKLASVRTIEGAEKIMDLEELVAYAASSRDRKMNDYVGKILAMELAEKEAELVSDRDQLDIDSDDIDAMLDRVDLRDGEKVYVLDVKKTYTFVVRNEIDLEEEEDEDE